MIIDGAIKDSIDLDFEIISKINKYSDFIEVEMYKNAHSENILSLKQYINELSTLLNQCDTQRKV